MKRFADRTDAGRDLAAALGRYRKTADAVVLALPRGGVPVAFEVAAALKAPLDVLVVRKIGAPGQPELAIGAVAGGDIVIHNDDVIAAIGVDPDTLKRATAMARAELAEKERRYRTGRAAVPLEGKSVFLIDDGAATGATMRAAIAAARLRGAREVIVALPTAAAEAADTLRQEADGLICLQTPEPYYAVGAWYRDFGQVSDAEVARLLSEANRLPAEP